MAETKFARSLAGAGGLPGAAALKGTIEVSDLDIGNEIGHGAFSRVFKGSYRGETVAVKKISVPRRDLDRHLTGELQLLSSPSMKHPNLIRYYGVAIEPMQGGVGQVINIVTEYMGGGDLRSVLKRRDVALPWALRVRLVRDVALALGHLHANELIHRDIKTENILLDDEWRCVLADYGFARKMAGPAGTAAAMTLCGTDEFMAPEILWGDAYSEAADIFSLGVVLWEVMARIVPGEAPPADSSPASSGGAGASASPALGFMSRQARTKFTLDFDAMRAALPADTPESLIACATECCAYEGEYRPSAHDVVEWLTDLHADLMAHEAAAAAGGGAGASPPPPHLATPVLARAASFTTTSVPVGTPLPSVITGRAASGGSSSGPASAGAGVHALKRADSGFALVAEPVDDAGEAQAAPSAEER